MCRVEAVMMTRKAPKMRTRALAIDVGTDLPSRAQPLSESAISAVFGGCLGQYSPCKVNSDCCQYLQCGAVYQYTPPGGINPLQCNRYY